MSQDIDFMIPPNASGGGGAPSGAAGGDLGSTYPNPTVVAGHFGGVDNQYLIRRSGLWVPSTPLYTDISGTPTSLPPSGNAGGDLGSTYPNPTVLAGNHITSEVTGTDFKPSGLAGAVAASRYAGATASGAPASGTFAVGDHIIDQTGKVWVCTAAGTPGTWVNAGALSGSAGGDLGSTYPNPTVTGGTHITTEVTGTDFAPSGLTGSVAASRYVGATASGAPTTGAHVVGDYVIDQTGKVWVCTAAGTPGTWVSAGTPSGSAGGDLGSTYPNPTVTGGTHITTEVTGTDFAPSGLTGSVSASRYVGATTSGAPTTGAHVIGDYVIDRGGKVWICTAAGTPGTWADAGAGGIAGASAGSTSLGALQTNVNSQFIAGTNTRGYIRITTAGTPPGDASIVALVSFSGTQAATPFIIAAPISSNSAIYGDSVAAPGAISTTLLVVRNPTTSGFSLMCFGLAAVTAYAIIYLALS